MNPVRWIRGVTLIVKWGRPCTRFKTQFQSLTCTSLNKRISRPTQRQSWITRTRWSSAALIQNLLISATTLVPGKWQNCSRRSCAKALTQTAKQVKHPRKLSHGSKELLRGETFQDKQRLSKMPPPTWALRVSNRTKRQTFHSQGSKFQKWTKLLARSELSAEAKKRQSIWKTPSPSQLVNPRTTETCKVNTTPTTKVLKNRCSRTYCNPRNPQSKSLEKWHWHRARTSESLKR